MFIVNFVTTNYVWVIVASIVILLAVIGSYADKINFGIEEKEVEKKKKVDISELKDKKMSDYVAVPDQAKNMNDSKDVIKTDDSGKTNSEDNDNEKVSNTIIVLGNDTDEINKINDVSDVKKLISNTNNQNVKTIKTNEKLDWGSLNSSLKLDKEVEAVLPKKEIINTDLLDDIDNLSFDDMNIEEKLFGKKHDFDFSSKINFDDLELPKIKSLKDTNEDIWKV